ncbi:AI-2E family transporter [Pseudoxanthomonas koreensis]|uniref:AI-2E family transporter n=1 Tax=Pseudoxanthomonas koreensis TaxID=266061 RepID=UPI0013910C00|nr:AI-2E family transporter [Pseudoxanthomonas koreensis]KAF1690074.1 AI-2E family transporter [Pseudoxanthomonas koreensis]
MNTDPATLRKLVTTDLSEMLIRFGVVVFLLVLCVRVFMPFAGLVGLSMILAIALYPAFDWLVRHLGGRRRLAGVVFVGGSLLLLGIPMALLGTALGGQAAELYDDFEHNRLAIPAPDPAIAEWPVVGERLYALWNEAAANLPVFVEAHSAPIKANLGPMLLVAADGALATLVFFAAIIVAGVMMVHARRGGRALERIVERLAGPERGPRLVRLSVATIRSVATGVVGVALIQSVLLGMGFLLADIPGAGVLALLVMILGILQLPVVVVSLPAAAWMWFANDELSTLLKIVFTVFFVLAGTIDNVLKPLLLGRGVDVPMLVVLIGAIGGVASAGIAGLFIGAVLLAVGYTVFSDWVANGEDREGGAAVPGGGEAPGA